MSKNPLDNIHPCPTDITIGFTDKVAPDAVEIYACWPVTQSQLAPLKDALRDAFNINAWGPYGFGGFVICPSQPLSEATVSLNTKHLDTPDLGKKVERVKALMKKLYT